MPTAAQPVAAQSESARAPDHSGGPEIEISRTVLEGGNINYSDNFIKPNYSAQLTEIKGKIGAFGTQSTKPADLEVQGQVNGSSPIDIVGSLNPLAPMAFVDIKAKADGIELSDLTPSRPSTPAIRSPRARSPSTSITIWKTRN